MKALKKIALALISIITLFCTISVIVGYTLVIPISTNEQLDNRTLIKGDTVNIFENADFSKGSWSVYINVSRNDLVHLSPSIKKAYCLKTSDIRVIEKMKNQWNFVYKEADMATVESTMYVLNNHKIVFESGIVLDKDKQGLQNSTYGWMETAAPGVLVETCKNFKKVYWPIIFL